MACNHGSHLICPLCPDYVPVIQPVKEFNSTSGVFEEPTWAKPCNSINCCLTNDMVDKIADRVIEKLRMEIKNMFT